MATRYGHLKQMDVVGPNDESILDYSIYDAKTAGFGDVVFVIRREFADAFRRKNNSQRFALPVTCVYQSVDTVPPSFTLPADRVKPWGTAHAILMAKRVIDKPFAVINADDFYGRDAFVVMANFLNSCVGKQNTYSMVAYRLKNTLSDFGTVSRGICTQDEQHCLRSIVERTNIAQTNSGIVYTDNDQCHNLDGNSLVSMNFFGFTPDFFKYVDDAFLQFLAGPAGTDIKSEFYITAVINNLIQQQKAQMLVLQSNASWFGVTYPDDKPAVVARIQSLIDQGVYPQKMWNLYDTI